MASDSKRADVAIVNGRFAAIEPELQVRVKQRLIAHGYISLRELLMHMCILMSHSGQKWEGFATGSRAQQLAAAPPFENAAHR